MIGGLPKGRLRLERKEKAVSGDRNGLYVGRLREIVWD